MKSSLPTVDQLTAEDLKKLTEVSKREGFADVSSFIHSLQPAVPGVDQGPYFSAPPKPKRFLATKLGTVYCGDSLGLMHHTLKSKSVDLLMTSPPFGLVRKKSCGNEDAHKYLDWFRPFAEGFKRVLKDCCQQKCRVVDRVSLVHEEQANGHRK